MKKPPAEAGAGECLSEHSDKGELAMRWFISILALWFIVGPTGATATEIRSCSGTLAVSSTSIAKINGEGMCKNKVHANDCRVNARNAIVACAKALFNARGSNKLPTICKGGRGAKTAVLQWNQIIPKIKADDIADRVRWNKCCRTPNNSNTNKQVAVKLTVDGDKGCGGSKVGSKHYRSTFNIGVISYNCQRQRQAGLCNN